MNHPHTPATAHTMSTWLITATGARLNLRWLRHDRIGIIDVAAQLAKINRWTGATSRLYSVAEHSLLVEEIMQRDLGVRDPAALLAGLLHDAHEYITGDLSSPMKALLGGGWAREEQRIQRHVLARFGVLRAFAAHEPAIHRADMIARATERRDLIAPGEPAPEDDPDPPPAAPAAAWVQLQQRGGLEWSDWRDAMVDRFAALRHGMRAAA